MTDILKSFPLVRFKIENGEKLGVAICTPLYGGIGMVEYFLCLMDTINLLKSLGIGCKFLHLKYESLVQRGRNTLTALALNDPDVTHVMFIDGDIKWNPVDVLRLLNDDKDIVGGLYPKKAYKFDRIKNYEKILQSKTNKQNVDLTDEQIIRHHLVDYNFNCTENKQIVNGLLEVRHLATGFIMIKRNVFDTLRAKHPEWAYIDDIHPNKIPNLHAFFDCFILNGQYLSEDWAFCDRWRSAEGKIYANLLISLVHIGSMEYDGRILTTLNMS